MLRRFADVLPLVARRHAAEAGATMVALHHSTAVPATALCAAVDLPASATAPEWVHLLPAGEIRTGDGRGPYRVADAARLIEVSLQAGERLPVDENHSTDLAAPRGEPAPARGWIVELQARADGVWGKVEWTEEGRQLVAGRAYRGISPVIVHQADGSIDAVLRASLVNKPNLRGLTALHAQDKTSENDMTLAARIAALLGLPAATAEDQLLTQVTALHQAKATSANALQAALDPIALVVGLQAGADAAAVLAGVQQKATAGVGDTAAITALQAELTSVTTQLTTLQETGKKTAAEAFVDGAIKAGRVGVKPLRDHYVARHMANPADVEKEIGGMPVLGGGGQIIPHTPPPADGEVALNAEQKQAAKLLGIAEADMAKTLKAEREAAL